MSSSRRPNEALRRLLAESGWTGAQLAGAVNAAAAEARLVQRYDRKAVSHWLTGRVPRPPMPDLIAEVLSRKLARTVTVAETGLVSSACGMNGPMEGLERMLAGERQAQPWDGDEVTGLIGLDKIGSGRRRMMVSCVYTLTGLATPSWVQAVAGRTSEAADRSSPRLTENQVLTATAMGRLFSSSDDAFGGGYARQALCAYLAEDVAPRLRASASLGLRRRMRTTATQLVYLAGFMCFDDELHGLAQRYYRLALRLAADNDDQAAYAITLRAMSVQAQTLGHHGHAVQLAEDATTTSRLCDPLRQAFLHGQLAVAHAANSDRVNALASLSFAEHRLEAALSPAGALIGIYHRSSLAHQQAVVRALLGDKKGAVATLTRSIRERPVTERRSRAITLAKLAELHLDQGNLDQAVQIWNRFLDDYSALSCGRATTALGTLCSRVRPYAANATARALLQRATFARVATTRRSEGQGMRP